MRSNAGELRTVLQTMDSARYRKDRPFDRFVDTGHARSEVFIALLFGYRIVVTANDVADSPAFQTIFMEIHDGAADELAKVKERAAVPFQVFSVGLEKRHQAGMGGYSAFASAYVSSAEQDQAEGRRIAELVGLGERSRLLDWDQLRTVKAAADTYFDNDSFFSRELEKSRPEDHRFYSLVREEYHAARNPEGQFVYGPDVMTVDNTDRFTTFVRQCTARARRRGADQQSIQAIEDGLRALREEGVRLGRRQDWERSSSAFGTHWPVVRDWLDVAVYQLAYDVFNVTFPSFFTQELMPGKQEMLVVQGAASDAAYGLFRGEAPEDAEDGILPVLGEVPWGDVLRLVSERRFQAALDSLHGAVLDARTARDVAEDERHRRIRDALDAHVDFLLQQDRRFAITRRGRNLFRTERGVVRFGKSEETESRWKHAIEDFMHRGITLGAVQAARKIGDPTGLSGLIPALVLKPYVERPARAISGSIERLRRPSEEAFAEGRAFVRLELTRRNLYIG